MDKLIEALQILLKYGNPAFPTHCEHDELRVYPGVNRDEISAEDRARLEELSFRPDDDLSEDGWLSTRYGSC